MLILFSVDEILPLKYMNWPTNIRGLPFNVEMAVSSEIVRFAQLRCYTTKVVLELYKTDGNHNAMSIMYGCILKEKFGRTNWNNILKRKMDFILKFICLFLLFNFILTIGYLMSNPFFEKNSSVHDFPKGICPNVNVVAPLEFRLTYNDSAVQRFNHYTTRTGP